jgi:hypothetical protein
MTEVAFSIENLLTAEERAAFGGAMAGLIRIARHDEAEAVLTDLLGSLPFPLARLCLKLPARDVTVTGRHEFNTRIEMMSSRGKPVTAVGIDITDQGDARDAQGRREQLLETNYYTDECGFAFSRASRDDILAESAQPTAAWVGGFADLDGSLSVSGLAPLYDALLQQPERAWSYMKTEEERLENLASYLAGWFRHLRVHQAVKRGLDENGLARSVPVLVGTNEVPPYLTAVYWPMRILDYREAAVESREAEEKNRRVAYAQHTEDQITRWREQREAIRSWSPRVNPDKRRTYIEFVEASEKLARHGTPLDAFDHGYQLSDADFERMVQTYRHHRDPSAAPPPPPVSPGAPRRIFGFGRRGR